MVAAMAERRAGGRRESVDQPLRRQTVRRKPARGIGEGGGADSDDDGDHDK
jgi:hypothetical protein